jgi:oxaloacetate decarboxylase alpha subunit
MQSHATTGMSTSTTIKATEAGLDMVDTSISSMSHTYGHSATESVVAILENTERDTGLNLALLEEIATHFREVRKKYTRFEGSLKGVDARILLAQVPGGMLTNMENQLREQDALNRFDEVLEEIPRVREDLGLVPLVTPTSQIIGSQSVVNVLTGERYKSITKEAAGVLKGEYGATPAPVNAELQRKVLDGADPVVCRPADRIDPEMPSLTVEVEQLARDEGFERSAEEATMQVDRTAGELAAGAAQAGLQRQHDLVLDLLRALPEGARRGDGGEKGSFAVSTWHSRSKVAASSPISGSARSRAAPT